MKEVFIMSEQQFFDDVVIEKAKIIRMVNRIYEIERENTKTGKRNEKEMKAEIERIIEEEAKKCY